MTAGRLSKAQFIKRASTMCRESKGQAIGEFRAFIAGGGRPGSKAADAEIVETILIPTYTQLIDRLSAIGAPEGEERELAAFLNELRRNLDSAKDEPIEAVSTLKNPFEGAARVAKRSGLTVCANSLA